MFITPATPFYNIYEIRTSLQEPKCPVSNATLCTQQKYVKVRERHKILQQVHEVLINGEAPLILIVFI